MTSGNPTPSTPTFVCGNTDNGKKEGYRTHLVCPKGTSAEQLTLLEAVLNRLVVRVLNEKSRTGLNSNVRIIEITNDEGKSSQLVLFTNAGASSSAKSRANAVLKLFTEVALADDFDETVAVIWEAITHKPQAVTNPAMDQITLYGNEKSLAWGAA